MGDVYLDCGVCKGKGIINELTGLPPIKEGEAEENLRVGIVDLIEYDVDIIYITEEDVSDLDCTKYHEVSRKYGFKHTDDFWDAFHDGKVLCKKDDGIYNIEVTSGHDIYNGYNVGELISSIKI
jgi:hypothetical protein